MSQELSLALSVGIHRHSKQKESLLASQIQQPYSSNPPSLPHVLPAFEPSLSTCILREHVSVDASALSFIPNLKGLLFTTATRVRSQGGQTHGGVAKHLSALFSTSGGIVCDKLTP